MVFVENYGLSDYKNHQLITKARKFYEDLFLISSYAAQIAIVHVSNELVSSDEKRTLSQHYFR